MNGWYWRKADTACVFSMSVNHLLMNSAEAHIV